MLCIVRHDACGDPLTFKDRLCERVVEAGGDVDLIQGRVAEIDRLGEVVLAGHPTLVDVAFRRLDDELAVHDGRQRRLERARAAEETVKAALSKRVARRLEVEVEDLPAGGNLQRGIAGGDRDGRDAIGDRGIAGGVGDRLDGNREGLGRLLDSVIDDRDRDAGRALVRGDDDRVRGRGREVVGTGGAGGDGEGHRHGLAEVANAGESDNCLAPFDGLRVTDRDRRRQVGIDRLVGDEGTEAGLTCRAVDRDRDGAIDHCHRNPDEAGSVGATPCGEGVVVVGHKLTVDEEVPDARAGRGVEQFREMQLDDVGAGREARVGRGPDISGTVAIGVIGRSVEIHEPRVAPRRAGLAINVGVQLCVGLGTCVVGVVVGLEGDGIPGRICDEAVRRDGAAVAVVVGSALNEIDAQRSRSSIGSAEVDRPDDFTAHQVGKVGLKDKRRLGRCAVVACRVAIGTGCN